MDFTQKLKEKGFSLLDVSNKDLDDFIYTEKVSHHKYVAQHKSFFGEWNEQILKDSFYEKMQMTYFKRILKNGETAGFLSFNEKADKIDSTFLRILPRYQNNGIGTAFLSHLQKLSNTLNKPLYLVAIRTNPAHELYRSLGFECYNEDEVFYYFRYNYNI